MSRTILFAQQKGGAGKTTLLVQLAVIWAGEGRRVALLDLDPQGSLTRWGALRADPALPVIESAEWRAGTDLRRAKREADIVLADCPGAADVLLRAAMREADLVLVPAQPSAMDAWATAATLEMARRERTPARVALNRVPPRGGAVERSVALLREQGAEILASRLGQRVAFAASFLSGRAACEISRASAAAREARALAGEVLALLDAEGGA